MAVGPDNNPGRHLAQETIFGLGVGVVSGMLGIINEATKSPFVENHALIYFGFSAVFFVLTAFNLVAGLRQHH